MRKRYNILGSTIILKAARRSAHENSYLEICDVSFSNICLASM